jgi:hypothetical protein
MDLRKANDKACQSGGRRRSSPWGVRLNRVVTKKKGKGDNKVVGLPSRDTWNAHKGNSSGWTLYRHQICLF